MRAARLLEGLPAVICLDVADGAGAGAHHNRVRASAVLQDFYTLEHIAAGDAGRREADVLRPDEVAHAVDAVKVHALGGELLAFLVGTRPDLRQHLPADA